MAHNNKKCIYDNYKFDSYAEKDDYIYQKCSKDVKAVIVKPRFILQKGFSLINGKKIREIAFTPDLLLIFSAAYIQKHGFRYELRDTKPWNKKKGKFVLEPIFKLKWKMLKYKIFIYCSLKYTSPSGNGEMTIASMSNTRFTLTA